MCGGMIIAVAPYKVCIAPEKMLQLRHCSPVERNG